MLAMKTRANLQWLQLLTYNIDQKNAELLLNLNSDLVKLYDDVYQQLPSEDGIALRTHHQRNIATIYSFHPASCRKCDSTHWSHSYIARR